MQASHIEIATVALRWYAAYTRKSAANSAKQKHVNADKAGEIRRYDVPLAVLKELDEARRMERHARRALCKVCISARHDLVRSSDANLVIDARLIEST